MLSHVSAPHFGFWLLSPAWVAIVFVSASSHWWAVASCYVLYFHLLSFRPRNKSSTENGLECLPKALVTFHIAGTKQTNNTAAKTATSRRNGLFPPLASVDSVHQFHSRGTKGTGHPPSGDREWRTLCLLTLAVYSARTSVHKILHSARGGRGKVSLPQFTQPRNSVTDIPGGLFPWWL